jgi:hypothetical protein
MRTPLLLGVVLSAILGTCNPASVRSEEAPTVPSQPSASASDVIITVHLLSGRSFTAALDARTDVSQLWLRFGHSGTTILRPIEWNHVVSANLDGHTVSGDHFRRMVRLVRLEIPAQPVAAL